MTFASLISKLLALFHPVYQEPLSPLAKHVQSTPVQSTPQPVYRNPRMPEFIKKHPKDAQEIFAASRQASKGNKLLESLLNDLALEESGLNRTAKSKYSSALGPWQFIKSTSKHLGLEDPTDATAAAQKVVEALNKRHLKWWETYARGGATKTPIKKLYSQKELELFLR